MIVKAKLDKKLVESVIRHMDILKINLQDDIFCYLIMFLVNFEF